MLLHFNVFFFYIYFPECEFFVLYFSPSIQQHQNQFYSFLYYTPKQIFSLSIALCLHFFIFHMYTFMRLYSSFTKAFFFTTLTSVKKSSLELLFFYSSFSVYSCKCYPHAKKTIYYFMCCKQQFFYYSAVFLL